MRGRVRQPDVECWVWRPDEPGQPDWVQAALGLPSDYVGSIFNTAPLASFNWLLRRSDGTSQTLHRGDVLIRNTRGAVALDPATFAALYEEHD